MVVLFSIFKLEKPIFFYILHISNSKLWYFLSLLDYELNFHIIFLFVPIWASIKIARILRYCALVCEKVYGNGAKTVPRAHEESYFLKIKSFLFVLYLWNGGLSIRLFTVIHFPV